MPSLFSRVRTTSTPTKAAPATTTAIYADQGQDGVTYDELGRIVSRGSTARGVGIGVSSLPASKKAQTSTPSKKKGRKGASAAEEEEPAIPDNSFLPLHLEPPPPPTPRRPTTTEGNPQSQTLGRQQQAKPDDAVAAGVDYGYLSYQRHIILGLEEVDRLVRTLADELGARGLTTPFIFSSLALAVSAQGVRRLVDAFLRTCAPFPGRDADDKWRDEVRFAGPHELGMALRWGLARVVRVVGGNAVRGLIPWENYLEWADSEVALHYPPTYFGAFLEPFQPLLRNIIFNVLSLLARLTAHSASSGHTPPTLSPLFGPLLFGLGSPALAFQHAYVHYLRATNATEHILLAFVRWQDAPSNDSASSVAGPGAAASLGVPARLKDWIRGYPAMLPERARKQDRLAPRRGARTVRVVSVRRNVRMYTHDLVRLASAWAARGPQGPNAFGNSKEWARVAPPGLRLTPRYSDSFRKRMDLPSSAQPATSSSVAGGSIGSSASASTDSSTSSALHDDDYFGLAKEDERFRSLTDLKWGEFESMGFGGLASDEKKLQFDLTESARSARAAKRTTLTWTDFSAAGFSRTDAPLNATLEFSLPVESTIRTWPEQQDEIRRKLKKTQRGLPPFGWDTEPVMGAEEVIEEAFLDVFCDLVYGGGWMDVEREEEFDRECNWALVEYKSLPVARTTAAAVGGPDPRTSTIVFLFEEFVPSEYRQQLSAGVQNKRRLPFFSSSKSRAWKPAATLNGRPYVVGATPNSPSVREVDFEQMLRANTGATKVMHLNGSATVKGSRTSADTSATARPAAAADSIPPSALAPASNTDKQISAPLYINPRDSDLPSPLRAPSPARKHRFRLPMPMTGATGSNRTSGLPPSEYEDVDFETRETSPDELVDPDSTSPLSRRRRSKDDAWVDILVAGHGRRLAVQDAEVRPRPGGPRPIARADPDAASLEVAQVLSGVRMMSEAELGDGGDGEGDIEPMTVPHRSQMDDGDRDGDDGDSRFADDREPSREQEQEQESASMTKRRLGYFDLHPDRRPPTRSISSSQDDSRGRFSDESEGDEVPYPSAVRRADSTSSAIDVPDMRLGGGAEAQAHSKKDSLTLGGLVDTRADERGSSSSPLPPAPKATTSRTAALIEMYKQRDAAATAAPSLVKSGNGQALPVPKSLPQTPKDVTPQHTPSPPAREEDGDQDVTLEDLEPPKLGGGGRDSPYRYVHGAPLHNVTEEEEED